MSLDEKEPGLLTYLPSTYQENARDEKGPLRTLVTIFDCNFSKIIEIIDRIDRYFDPFMAPVEPDESGRDFLSWLASWVSLVFDDLWPEKKKRRLIKKAAELYKLRGTPMGLKNILEEFFDIEVEIREWTWPPGMIIGRHSTIGTESCLIEKEDKNYCFKIILKSEESLTPKLIRKIRTVIDLEKPAHTKCYLWPDLKNLKRLRTE